MFSTNRFLQIAIFCLCIVGEFALTARATQAKRNAKLSDSFLKNLVRADQKLGKCSPGLKHLKSLARKAQGLESYTVKVRIWTFKNSGTRLDGGTFHYLRPDLIKVKVTEGKRKGSTVVKRKDGTIRGYSNSAFKIFARTLKPDSKRLYATNGYHLLKSDFASLLSKAVKRSRGPGTVLITQKVIDVKMARSSRKTENIKSKVIELYHSKELRHLISRIYINPRTNMPIQWCDYENNRPSFITRFIDLDRDRELTCKNFDLGFRIPVP